MKMTLPNLRDLTAYFEIYKLLKIRPAGKREIKLCVAKIYKKEVKQNQQTSKNSDDSYFFFKPTSSKFVEPDYTKEDKNELSDTKFYKLLNEMRELLNLEIIYNDSSKAYTMTKPPDEPFQLQLLNQFATLYFFQTIYANYDRAEVEAFIDSERIGDLGEQYLSMIFKALKARKWVSIKYQTFTSNQVKEHIVAPLLLKQYDHRWYLFAVKEGDPNKTGIKSQDAAILFGLERIKDLTITDRKIEKGIFENLPAYEKSKDVIKKPADIFDNIIGVRFTDETNAMKTEIIELQFTKVLAPYIKSKHLHSSQETIKENENRLHIKLYLKVNQELKTLLLSYGAGVKILYPESLKKDIKASLEEALKQY